MERNLLTQGGTIAVDNVLMRGTAYSEKGEILDKNIPMGKGIKSFNNYVAADDRVCQVRSVIKYFCCCIWLVRMSRPVAWGFCRGGEGGGAKMSSTIYHFRLATSFPRNLFKFGKLWGGGGTAPCPLHQGTVRPWCHIEYIYISIK